MKNYWFIGDIHGEVTLLDGLLSAIKRQGPERIIFVGDYIDRGPHSREVLDRIMELDLPVTSLMGNHEQMMLNALEDSVFGNNPMELWYRNGGEATLLSFGFSSFFSFQSEMDTRYLEFFRNLRLNHVIDLKPGLRILATHAGITPSIPVADQLLLKDYLDLEQYMINNQLDPGDSFLWAREAFFTGSSDLWKGYMVIHGHTPTMKLKRYVEAVGFHDYQFVGNDLAIRRSGEKGAVVSVGIDSGSTISGRLSALGIFIENEKSTDGIVHMKSLTATREDIISRELGPIGP